MVHEDPVKEYLGLRLRQVTSRCPVFLEMIFTKTLQRADPGWEMGEVLLYEIILDIGDEPPGGKDEPGGERILLCRDHKILNIILQFVPWKGISERTAGGHSMKNNYVVGTHERFLSNRYGISSVSPIGMFLSGYPVAVNVQPGAMSRLLPPVVFSTTICVEIRSLSAGT